MYFHYVVTSQKSKNIQNDGGRNWQCFWVQFKPRVSDIGSKYIAIVLIHFYSIPYANPHNATVASQILRKVQLITDLFLQAKPEGWTCILLPYIFYVSCYLYPLLLQMSRAFNKIKRNLWSVNRGKETLLIGYVCM